MAISATMFTNHETIQEFTIRFNLFNPTLSTYNVCVKYTQTLRPFNLTLPLSSHALIEELFIFRQKITKRTIVNFPVIWNQFSTVELITTLIFNCRVNRQLRRRTRIQITIHRKLKWLVMLIHIIVVTEC